jgi:2-haloalkanoic acid dehalogenase type II
MPWSYRGGRKYFSLARRGGGRVTNEYLGSGEDAVQAATEIERRRAERLDQAEDSRQHRQQHTDACSLRDANYRLMTLTNSSKAAAADQVKNAGLADFFEALLSVEEVGKYKPHAEVYRWAAGRVGADLCECLMVAAHGWDVAGAAWAGMRTAFVARPGQQVFPLGPTLDITIPSLAELASELDRM